MQETVSDPQIEKLFNKRLSEATSDSPKRILELEKQIQEVMTNDFEIAFTKEYLEELCKKKDFREVGIFLKKILQQTLEIRNKLMNPNSPLPDLLIECRKLTEILSGELPSGSLLNLAHLVPEAELQTFMLRLAKLEATPQPKKRRIEEFRNSTARVVNHLLKPTTFPVCIAMAEQSHIANADLPNFSDFPAMLTSWFELYQLKRGHEKLVSDQQLGFEESEYVRLSLLNKARAAEIVTPALAKELINKDVWEDMTSLEDFLSSYLNEVPPDETKKDKKKTVSRSTKPLRSLGRFVGALYLCASMLIGYQNTTEEGRSKLVKDLVSFSTGFAQNVRALVTSPAETIKKIDTKKIVRDLSSDPQAKKDSAKKTEDAIKPPERKFNADPLTPDKYTWNSSVGDYQSSERDFKGNASVKAEQFLNQSSQIEWIVETPGTASSPTSFITRFAPFYTDSPEFEGFSGVKEGTALFMDNSKNLDDADIIIRTKKEGNNYIGGMSIPVPWGFHTSAVIITEVDTKTKQTIRQFDSKIKVNGINEQSVSLLGNDNNIIANIPNSSEIHIAIGLKRGNAKTFDSGYLFGDKDSKFHDRTIFPPEVLELIDRLNANPQLSDVQKLTELRKWFRDNFTYSFDNYYSDYYNGGFPKPSQETIYRRILGTGNKKNDPLYSDTLDMSKRGICEGVNVLFALAARELDLKNGQVILASGFLNNGVFTNMQRTLTGGQRHAWAIYLDDDGLYSDFDATPTRADEYSNSVLNAAKSSQEPKPDETMAKRFDRFPRPYRDNSVRSPSRLDNTIATLSTNQPLPEVLPYVEEQPIGSWKITLPYSPSFQSLEAPKINNPFTQLNYASSNYLGGATVRYYYNKDNFSYDVSLHDGFSEDYFNERLKLSGSSGITMEDVTPKITGLVKINGNSITLPSYGQISPRSLTVEEVITDEQGKRVRVPIVVSGLRFNRDDTSYTLIFEGDSFKLDGRLVEVSYRSFYNMQKDKDGVWFANNTFTSKDTSITPDSAAEWFKPFFSRESLDQNFQAFLHDLETKKDLKDLLDHPSAPDELPKSLLNIVGNLSLNSDSNKLMLIREYIAYHYTITYNHEWKDLYLAQEADDNTFISRVSRYKKIDENTATYLLVGAARTLESNQGAFPIPVGVQTIISSQEDIGIAAGIGESSLIQSQYLTETEKKMVPLLYRYTPKYTDSYGITFDEGFTSYRIPPSSYARVPLDTLSRALLAREIISGTTPEVLSQPQFTPVATKLLDSALSGDEMFSLNYWEIQKLRASRWWELDQFKPGEFIAAGMFLLLVYERMRRKTKWENEVSPEGFQQALTETAAEIGITTKNNLAQEAMEFNRTVLRRKYSRIPLVNTLQKVKATSDFVSRLNWGPESSWKRGFTHIGQKISKTSSSPFNTTKEGRGLWTILTELANTETRKEMLDDVVHNSREVSRLLGIALDTTHDHRAEEKVLARKLLTKGYGKEYVPRLLYSKMGNLAEVVSGYIDHIQRNYYADLVHAKDPGNLHSYFAYGIPQEITRLALSDPEQFKAQVGNHFLWWMLRQANDKTGRSEGEIKEDYDKLPPEAKTLINHMATILVGEALLPYYILVEQEKAEVTATQLKLHKNKKKRKKI